MDTKTRANNFLIGGGMGVPGVGVDGGNPDHFLSRVKCRSDSEGRARGSARALAEWCDNVSLPRPLGIWLKGSPIAARPTMIVVVVAVLRALSVERIRDAPVCDFRCVSCRYFSFRLNVLPPRDSQAAFGHFFPTSASPAFLRSSGVMTIRNSTSALKARNHGSATEGIFDGSARSKIRIPPRCPFLSVK